MSRTFSARVAALSPQPRPLGQDLAGTGLRGGEVEDRGGQGGEDKWKTGWRRRTSEGQEGGGGQMEDRKKDEEEEDNLTTGRRRRASEGQE